MTDAIERTLELDVSPERVWRALTDPEELSAWFPDDAREMDVRPAGDGWWHWEAHGSYAVRFDVVDRPRRLVWTWAREPGVSIEESPTTTVEWRLEPRDDGSGTRLHLREEGFLTPEDRAQNVEGWNRELAELRHHLSSPG
jgi:uncharacterized protein YndB with AHSA1/START domain